MEPTATSLPDRLRVHLITLARRGATTTYADVARVMRLHPPHTIQQVAAALETLIEEDVAAGVPPVAALVLAPWRGGLPAPGFFDCARRLLGYGGPDEGRQASAFHAELLRQATAHWAMR